MIELLYFRLNFKTTKEPSFSIQVMQSANKNSQHAAHHIITWFIMASLATCLVAMPTGQAEVLEPVLEGILK